MFEGKRILVTGIGGAIGIHLFAHIMHNSQAKVIGVDSFRHKGYPDRISMMLEAHPDWRERLTVITHDLTAPFTGRQVGKLEKIDYIINLASLSDVQDSIEDPVTFVRNNSDLMLNMLQLARIIKPAVFLHFSTDEVYGPARIDQGHPEWDTILPSNPYAASKAAQEAYAIAWWRSYDVPVIITNTMNNFGETQSPSKYPAMIQSKVARGETVSVHVAPDGTIGTRHYLHSRNAADAVLFILNNTKPYLHRPGHVDRPDRYNIVGDKQLNNLELAQMIAGLMGKELKYELVNFHATNPGHDSHYGLGGSKLANLGWVSPVTLEESMKNNINWQTEHLEWMK